MERGVHPVVSLEMFHPFKAFFICGPKGHENPGPYWDEEGNWYAFFVCKRCGKRVKIKPISGF